MNSPFAVGDEKENKQFKSLPSVSKDEYRMIDSHVQRTPLHAINAIARQKSTVKRGSLRSYSPITPVTFSPRLDSDASITGDNCTSRRRQMSTTSIKRLTSSHRRSRVLLSDDVMLNTMIYEKAKRFAEIEMKQFYEAQITEKDRQLLELQNKVDQLEMITETHQVMMAGSTTQTSFTACVNDKNIMTSPLCPFLPRLSDGAVLTLDLNELASQLEMATISSEILRSELSMLQKYRDDTQQDLRHWQLKAESVEDRIASAVAAETATCQKRIEEQQAQQSVQLQKISTLQQQLKYDELHALERDSRHAKELLGLREHIVQLQRDLTLAYGQKQQETENCTTYRKLYQQSIENERLLKMQMDEFLKLQPALDHAKEIQMKVVEAIQQTHSKVKSLKEQTETERAVFVSERLDWMGWKEKIEDALDTRRREYEEAFTVRDELIIIKQLLAVREAECDHFKNEVDALNTQLATETLQIADYSAKLKSMEEHAADLLQQLDASEERRDQEVTNLQHTLDQREHEVDELQDANNKLHGQVTLQKIELEKLRKETRQLRELGAKVTEVEAQMMSLQVRSTSQRESLEGTIRALSEVLAQTRSDLGQSTEVNKSLETSCEQMRNDVMLLEKELMSARLNEQFYLKAHQSDIDGALSALANLTQTRSTLLDEIGALTDIICGQKPHSCESDVTVRHLPSLQPASCIAPRQASYVSTLINAATSSQSESCRKRADDESNSDDVSCEYEDVVSTPELTTTSHNKDCTADVSPAKSDASLKSSSAESLVSGSLSDRQVDLRSTSPSDYTLSDRIETVNNSLHRALVLLQDAKSTVHSKICNLEGQLSSVHSEHMRVVANGQRALDSAEERARIAQDNEAQLKIEVKDLQSMITQCNEDVIKLKNILADKDDELMRHMDQSSTITKLKEDLESAQKRCNLKEEEIVVLNEAINDRLLRIERIVVGTGGERELVKQLKDLLDENHRLQGIRAKLLKQMDSREKQSSEAYFQLEKMHQTSTEYLRTAENALALIDEKLERTRQALCPHVEYLQSDPAMFDILNELGVFSQ